MKKQFSYRLLSLLLTLTMVFGLLVPVSAAGSGKTELKFEKVDEPVSTKLSESVADEEGNDIENGEYKYADDEEVRVSIVLANESTVEKYGSSDLASNSAAISYREELKAEQADVTEAIEAALGSTLDVKWNLTLAANIISANVVYEQIETIENVAGVEKVVIENRYDPMVVDTDETNDPNMATSTIQTGSDIAWAAGYTGAGSKIAVVDTGIDYEHQSFTAAGYEYSLANLAGAAGMTIDEYKESIGVLTTEDIDAVLTQLNAYSRKSGMTADSLYVSSKIPFGFNYIDSNYTIDHVHDSQGEHGSHVEGIAAANKYIPNDDGTFSSALDTVKVQGVAPDAQIIVMKVFGAGGGAYDSDYMAAIEDAVILGCDSVNLSLGSGNPGFSRSDEYQDVLDSLAESGTVVSMSAGNSYNWANTSSSGIGYLYDDEINFQVDGSPGSYSNSLTVASIANAGSTGYYFTVEGQNIFYVQTNYTNASLTTLSGEQEYVFINGFGQESDFEGIDVKGKVVFCSRGTTSFYQKAEAAVAAGAIATIIYNNQSGTINMDLSSYTKTAPCVSITQADGAYVKSVSTVSADGKYYTGKMTITSNIGAVMNDADVEMSDFSSWGTPGSLELKPEITAPGGSIYSVWGANNSSDSKQTAHDQYETMSGTSMASPQVAGMAAVLGQYIRENDLTTKTGLTQRQLINSLLMSTATPVIDPNSGNYYSVLNQGAGLANVGDAVNAQSYVLVDENLSGTASDGKVKAELGDDPDKTGDYTVDFTVTNFSDEDTEYTFSTDMFTQDMFDYDYTYLDTWTALLDADITYTVNGTEFVPNTGFECDVDCDGDTDSDDAQAIIDHVVGNKVEKFNEDAADVDGDGEITSYDAHLLLKNLTLASVEVDAGETINVSVNIKLTDAQKAYLDETYPVGAYVEGYIFVETANTEDGAVLPAHSIPVLGFYGNWSDASAYETSTYVEKLYGDDRTPHTGVVATNYVTIRYPGESTNYIYTINPYFVEGDSVADIPYERAAINSNSVINQYKVTLERNAAAVVYFVKDADGNIVYMGPVSNQVISAYYYVNGGSWRNTTSSLTANQKPATLGFKEGDVFTAGLAFIPEYYEDDVFDSDSVKAVLESDVLGEGAYLTNTFTVDDTAPELVGISKDLLTGDITVTAKDNQYIAELAIYRGIGNKLISGVVPTQTEAGQECSETFDLDDSVGEYIKIVVADYAGNETTYKVYYGGTPEDFTGRMFGFTSGTNRGNGARWVEADPATLSSTAGLTDFEEVTYEAYAADYIGGYVFFATLDGIYAASQEAYSETSKVASFNEIFEEDEYVADMAFNTQNSKLYVLTNHLSNTQRGTIAYNVNALYTVDYVSGEIEKVADITVDHSVSSYRVLRAFTIDDEGNFYGVNSASSSFVSVYEWTLDDITDGKLTVYGTSVGKSGVYFTSYASMAYDHDKDIIYLAGGYGAKNSVDVDNELWVYDPVAKTIAHPNTSNNAQFYDHTVALYVVPANTVTLPKNPDVERVVLNHSRLSLLKGSTVSLEASVLPWLVSDKSVTWTTSDASTVSVDANGTIETLKVGTATITATSVADPTKYATCTVEVTKLDNVELSGLVYGSDSKAYWSEFETDDTEAWTSVAEGASYYAGTLQDDEILVHTGDTMFGVDPDTFAITSYGGIASSWIWSDAAAAPATEEGYFGRMIGICMNGTYIEMLNPVEGSLSYWDLSSAFGDDPMATIAYSGSGTYYYSTIDFSTWSFISGDWPANFYYAMTESGKLYKFIVFTYNEGDSYTMVREEIGDTGLELTNVSAVTGGKYASMLYDETTGYILTSVYLDGEEATLYAINPETLIVSKVGTFGDKVWPVVSLYQYDRATDLTIKLDTSDITIYVKDNYKVSPKVILGETNELTWTTSDASVATVENGVITGVGEGTAVITCTTVDTNDNGEHISKSINVTVRGLVSVDATVNAQATINGTTAWVSIDLSDMSVSTNGSATTEIYGGGLSVGYLWGTDVKDDEGHIYRIDATTFEESEGSACSVDYSIRDVAENAAVEFTFTDDDKVVHSGTGFGDALYIPTSDGLYELVDYVEGSLSGWRASTNYTNLAAIAYVGDTTLAEINKQLTSPVTKADANTTCHVYYVLSTDGKVFEYNLIPIMTVDDDDETGAYVVSASLVRGTYATFDSEFTDPNALSAAYIEFSSDNYGLIISDETNGAVYYLNLADEEATIGKIGNVEGATNLTALYSAAANTASGNAMKSIMAREVKLEVEEAETTSIAPVVNAVMATSANAKTDAVEAFEATANVSVSAPVSTSVVNGSLNAASVDSVKDSDGDADEHVLTVNVKEDVAVTNGKYVVSYDPTKVTFVSAVSSEKVKAFNVDEENGKVVFAFASADAVEAGKTLATVTFEYGDYVETEIDIDVEERNDDTDVDEDTVVISIEDEVGGHDWVETDREDATCTENGYVDYECSKCGETKTEILAALGHNFVVKEGYAGLSRTTMICSRCGLEIGGNNPLPVINPITRPILNPTKPTTPVVEPKEDDDEEPVDETEEPVVEPVKDELPFVDVNPEDWYYTAVEYLYNEGIMNGTSDTEFSPEYELNRATIVTILYRLEGEPEVDTENTFSDVEPGEWYSDAVEWAASVGIVKGYEDGTFAPKKAVTREQLSAIIYRYAEYKGITIYETTVELGEEAVVSDWAKADVQWAVSEGLLVDGENVNATENANRAEVAAAIYTFLTKTAK